jgi:hypothetical protein
MYFIYVLYFKFIFIFNLFIFVIIFIYIHIVCYIFISFYPWVLHPVAHLSNLASYDAVNRNNVPICQLSYWNFVAIDGVIGSQVGYLYLIFTSFPLFLQQTYDTIQSDLGITFENLFCNVFILSWYEILNNIYQNDIICWPPKVDL